MLDVVARKWLLAASLIAGACLPAGCGGSEFTNAAGGAADGGDAAPETGGSAGTDASTDADAQETHDAPICTDSGDFQGVGKLGDPCCVSGQLACSGHASKLELFCDGEWKALESCQGQAVCDTESGTNQGSCQEPVAACVGQLPGATLCNGKDLITCGPDLVTSTTKTCAFACMEGACTGECTPGDAKCTGPGSKLITTTCTSDGVWKDGAPCAYVCESGACTGVCTPTSKQCNGNVPQTCDALGQWEDAATCAQVCSNGACVAQCVETSIQCSGLVPQVCTSGVWVDHPACQYLCANGTCSGTCSPDSKQCKGLVPQTCDSAGAWQDGTACSYLCSNGSCTGVCSPGSAKCSGVTPLTCDATGTWQTGVPCQFVCASGACTGVCSPGSQQCSGQMPQLCDSSGQWQDQPPACQYACTAGTCAGVCNQGDHQCNGIVPQVCQNGAWVDQAACQFVCASGACTGVCVPGALQCAGIDRIQQCDSTGQWQDAQTCPYICSGTWGTPSCTGTCKTGWTQCVGSSLFTCTAGGTWGKGMPCPGASRCLGGLCVPPTASPPSCGTGLTTCGPTNTDDCCATMTVDGGTFDRVNYQSVPPVTTTAATVSSFKLDRYEVTLARFNAFLNAGMGTQVNPPLPGAGAHAKIASSGWNSGWNSSLAASQTALDTALQCGSLHSWPPNQNAIHDAKPVSCVTWFEAQAFCAWDGGGLPTEAEWGYAAAGGSQQSIYPWGSATPDATYAVFGCSPNCSASSLPSVGSKSTKGDGEFGQADLAGSIAEWVLDWYATPYVNPCTDCALLTLSNGTGSRVFRGGSFKTDGSTLKTDARASQAPTLRTSGNGFRCWREGP